jgi:hypothetical protein
MSETIITSNRPPTAIPALRGKGWRYLGGSFLGVYPRCRLTVASRLPAGNAPATLEDRACSCRGYTLGDYPLSGGSVTSRRIRVSNREPGEHVWTLSQHLAGKAPQANRHNTIVANNY